MFCKVRHEFAATAGFCTFTAVRGWSVEPSLPEVVSLQTAQDASEVLFGKKWPLPELRPAAYYTSIQTYQYMNLIVHSYSTVMLQ